MKNILEKLIRRRNPSFRFDEAVSTRVLLAFAWIQFWTVIRGWRMLMYLRMPKMMMLGRRTSFFNIGSMKWGRFLKLGDNVYMSALGKEGIEIGSNVGIGAFSRIVVSTSLNNIGKHIRIGNNVGIGEYAYLGGGGGLEIGDDCIIGQYFSCHPENHLFADAMKLTRLQGVTREGIFIGNNCWIGSKVTILDGVNIGDGCIVAAGAVVTRSFPPGCILGGVPAKILRYRTAQSSCEESLLIHFNSGQ